MFHTLGIVKNTIGVGEEEPELRIESEKEVAQNCHHIIATTESEKEYLRQYYGVSSQKVGVIPCGVNLDLFRPVDKETARQRLGFTDEKIILFIGRIDPLKGIEQLLRAMPYLQNGHKPRLVIIGGDENSQHEIERLRGLCCDLQLLDSVTFQGLIQQEELPYFYGAADACVVPSYYESFGLVALESLACGTPVIANDVGVLKNIILQGETGYVIPGNSPRLFADKISLVLSGESSDAGSALGIRESVSRFGWSNIADAIIDECRMVLADYFALVS